MRNVGGIIDYIQVSEDAIQKVSKARQLVDHVIAEKKGNVILFPFFIL